MSSIGLAWRPCNPQPKPRGLSDANIRSQYRGRNGLWYGLTTRARAIDASKERVKPGDICTFAPAKILPIPNGKG